MIAMLVLPSGVFAQDSEQPGQSERFKKEELAQMVAPIALYPDSLIADILMASTYPLEVVEAERWLRGNKGLKGDALDNALRGKPWDASIKVLCHFPELLFSMSDKLDQTRKLGDAFLSQQEDVMAVTQELRHKAVEQGNLKTTKEQAVIADKDYIRIEPADPQIVYVPVYDPLYVYGPWWYPAYPPYYWYYPPGVVISGGYIVYGAGFFIGIDLFPWFWFDWHRHYIHIDHHRERRFERFEQRRVFDRPFWIHDPSHRRGVAYRDRITSGRFGGRTFQTSPSTLQNRGYPGTSPGGVTVTPSPIPETRGPSGRRFGGPTVAPQPGPAKRGEVTPAPRTRIIQPGVRGQKDKITPFSGVGNGGFERKAGERGGKSRQIEQQQRRGRGVEQKGESTGKGDRSRGFQKK